jgi:hypothetical protein
MSPEADDEQAREQTREAFVAKMKRRMEEAQASGQSPEEIRKQLAALAREESRRQLPQTIARARSWWSGFRNFLIVGAIALGLSIGLALFVEHRYAAPLCVRYAALHELTYTGLNYPLISKGSAANSASGSCIFENHAGHRSTVSLGKLEASWAMGLLITFALQLEFTTPVAFVLVALIAVGLRRRK